MCIKKKISGETDLAKRDTTSSVINTWKRGNKEAPRRRATLHSRTPWAPGVDVQRPTPRTRKTRGDAVAAAFLLKSVLSSCQKQ